MIKRIFWDFDGVIVDSVSLKTESFREIYKEYGTEISDKVVEYHLANGGVSRYKKFMYWHKEYLNIDLDPNSLEKLAARFSELVLEKVVASPTVGGFLDFIENNQNFEHYVVTGTPQKEIDVICERMHLSVFFKEIWGSPTTKIEWLEKAKEMFPQDFSESIFIGDSTTDQEAANHHSIPFILRNTEENQELFKDYVGIRINDFVNFLNVIEGI